VTTPRDRLRELYPIEFPDELYELWEWHGGLAGEPARAFGRVLGIRLVGPFDVLAGKFDGRELCYPAVLHWRDSWANRRGVVTDKVADA